MQNCHHGKQDPMRSQHVMHRRSWKMFCAGIMHVHTLLRPSCSRSAFFQPDCKFKGSQSQLLPGNSPRQWRGSCSPPPARRMPTWPLQQRAPRTGAGPWAAPSGTMRRHICKHAHARSVLAEVHGFLLDDETYQNHLQDDLATKNHMKQPATSTAGSMSK